MTVLFEKVCFIGMGLIASSLARVMRREHLAGKIVGVARTEETAKKALALNIVDEMFDDVATAVENADLVMLCTPVGSFHKIMTQASAFLKDGCIVSDVGSVKQRVLSSVMPLIPKGVFFVPAHPVAGTEKSGPENGFDTLFEGRWGIITPCEKSSLESVEKIRTLWEKAGMNVEEMSAKRHDAVMAIVSHVPHLIAYTIVQTAIGMEQDGQEEVIRFSAGGFRDFTRIAGADPVMWRDIFLENTDAVLDVLERFSTDLEKMKRAIIDANGDVLQKTFAHSRQVRRQVVEALQDQPENEKRLLQKR